MKPEKEVVQPHDLLIKKVFVFACLLILVLASAFMVVLQVYSYRQDYSGYNDVVREKENLNAEWGRLLIEKETFGATAQIGTRAVTQLRMYSPPAAQTIVISLANAKDQKQ
ncbi:cell division protein FtsL [Acinetobacter rudis]|uniref:Cell division protein FtsL n=1 Tax=Acinetobacter rudis TaxID=632955 RepID=A0AAW8J7W4_9GAMM|nr:cell division protein FtsL [Acinetobacter rudis]MDQ8935207.1 cell division protein FtsL [Acinetobacter rudis]MDQ8953070.1 cell division protein FtsL [Acinetobacter rudis]MDQ9017075.1 cell division protein FtsL [Acinetobacter rudis]